MANTKKFDALPQRQKKYARTKLALLHSMLEMLETQSLASVHIKDLCNKAEISEPTFFNYFNSKSHILLYFIQFWSLEMHVLARKMERASVDHTQTIKNILLQTARDISIHPQIMLEIIAFQAQGTEFPLHEITDAEKWLYFSDVDGVESIHGAGIESILPPLIRKAVARHELSEETDEELLFLTLSSLFFGTSLLVLLREPDALPTLLEAELEVIFKGAGYEK